MRLDLNPARAGMAEILEESDHTSIKSRLESRRAVIDSRTKPNRTEECRSQAASRSWCRSIARYDGEQLYRARPVDRGAAPTDETSQTLASTRSGKETATDYFEAINTL